MRQRLRSAILTVMATAVETTWRVIRRVVRASASTFDRQDVVLIVGMAMLAAGLSQVYEPLLLITPGALLTYLAWPKRPHIVVKSKPHQES